MALNEKLGLLLPVAWHDLTKVISLQASGSCGPAVSVSGRWPCPRASKHTCITTSCRLTSRSEQNTDDTLKAYLTDIMWIIARSLALRKLEF